jgi:pyruvate dehydrogenase E2 component (dihydrolipoamide acetyltransferase)
MSFTAVKDPSAFRKIAAAMWKHPSDPTIYGAVDIDASAALAFLEKYREKHAVRVTISHLCAMAIARAIAKNPEVNAKVRFWGRLEQRESIDITLQVATDGGQDLGAALIRNADRKTLKEIADELGRQAKSIREGRDENYARTRGAFRRMPWWLTRPAIVAADFLTNELHVNLPKQGLPRDPFGSAMVTNVGMFGIDTAFAPFTPIARCPILVLVPEVRDRPWVVQGQVVSRPVLRLCATFDHRVIDGFQAGKLSRSVSELLHAPEQLDG